MSPSFALAQSKDAQKPKEGQEADPLKRELSEEQKRKNAKAFKKEVGGEYKKWLENDVKWIISGEELTAFKQLSNDEERDQFIEQFWLRRDPTPDTVENEYRDEHYRRIAYANENFPSGIPGWRTDRGRIYIVYGPPDSIDSHPSGGSYMRPQDEGGGQTSTFPFEVWRYRYIEGIGQEIELEFVDDCNCGKYELTIDRSKKDALLNVPGAGLTDYEAMGMSSKSDRFGGGIERIGRGPFNGHNDQSKFFDRMEILSKVLAPPKIKFKDFEEVVSHKIRYNMMPFDVRVDYVKVTDDSLLVPVTVQIKNKDVTFTEKDGVATGVVNIAGRVSSMTGKVVQTFEDTVTVTVPAELRAKTQENQSVYWKALPLRVGRYRMDVVVKDVNDAGGRVGVWTKGIVAPNLSEDRGLVTSSLILADQMEKVPTRQVGAGNFVIGTTKVRPRVEPSDGKAPASFKRTQKANFWMQVYNLGVDEKTKKNDATIEYEVVNTATNKAVVSAKESAADLGSANASQVTLEKTLSLASLDPGIYNVVIKVNDNVNKATVQQTGRFAVE